MRKSLIWLIAAIPMLSHASWQADHEYGQGDALGIVLFFYAFLVYVIVRDGFKESKGKGWRCLIVCLVIGYLIATYAWALAIACLVFVASFLAHYWEKIK